MLDLPFVILGPVNRAFTEAPWLGMKHGFHQPKRGSFSPKNWGFRNCRMEPYGHGYHKTWHNGEHDFPMRWHGLFPRFTIHKTVVFFGTQWLERTDLMDNNMYAPRMAQAFCYLLVCGRSCALALQPKSPIPLFRAINNTGGIQKIESG